MSKTTAAILLALMGLVFVGLVGGCKKHEGENAGTATDRAAR